MLAPQTLGLYLPASPAVFKKVFNACRELGYRSQLLPVYTTKPSFNDGVSTHFSDEVCHRSSLMLPQGIGFYGWNGKPKWSIRIIRIVNTQGH